MLQLTFVRSCITVGSRVRAVHKLKSLKVVTGTVTSTRPQVDTTDRIRTKFGRVDKRGNVITQVNRYIIIC